MAAKNSELGDLVWAKMKTYPFWPAQIVDPPVVNKKALDRLPKKKLQHYVFFFGTKNFAWISEENIVPHSEEMLSKGLKKKSSSYVKAVKEIIRASRGEDSVESDESSGSPEIHKKRGRRSKRKMKRGKTKKSAETLNLHLTTDTQQPFATDVSNKELSPVQNLSSVSNDHSAPVANISQNIGRISGFNNQSEFEYFPPLNYLGEVTFRVTSKKIGFVGLGMIGERIVKRLLNAGHDVSVWNRTSEKCQGCVAAGARQLRTPADVVWRCDIIFCCVSGQEAVGSILPGNDGILNGLERSVPGSKGYIDLTSMNPVIVQKINELIASKGGKYLEAPISDSMSNIEEGSLLILVTGHRRLLDDCMSCFYAIAKRICFMNCEVGSASKMNIVLSMLKGSTYATLAESMALLEIGKILHSNFKNILPLSQMSAPYVIQKCEAMMQNNTTIDTLVKYQQKDLELGIQLSNSYKQPCPMMSAALGIYQTCTQRGYSMEDVSALYLKREETD
ncbi:putative oxidoreductase GLYR1 [Trichonephila clavipes]|nr:putative oxidoreductase GLYR1 [Trichonephila clavipes]